MTDEPAVCERCGNFAPLHPSWNRMLCDACLARRLAVETARFTVGGLWSGSIELLREIGLSLLGWALALGVLNALVQIALEELQRALPWHARGKTVSFVLNGAGPLFADAATTDMFGAAIALVALERVEHERVLTWPQAWRRVALRWPQLFALNVLVALGMSLAILACCVPGFAIGTLFLLAVPIMLRENLGPLRSLQQSTQRIRSVFWPALGAVAVAMVPSLISAVMGGALRLQVNSGFGLLISGASSLVSYVLWVPGLLMAVVAYVKVQTSRSASEDVAVVR